MMIISLVLLNMLVLVGAYALICWLTGDDVLHPVRVDPRDRGSQR